MRKPDIATFIGTSAFRYNELTSVMISSNVTSIRDLTFANNRLTSITIPSGVATVKEHAFYENDLTSVIIPNNVTSIANGVFRNNENLTSACIEAAEDNITIHSNTFPTSVTITYDSDCSD